MAEPADKPGSVGDSHSSRRSVAATLQQPTRTRRGPRHEVPIRPCSRWGLPCRSVAGLAVRSYRTISPLPVPCPPESVGPSAVSFCCTVRRLAPPRRYLAPCPVEPGLSSAPHASMGDATVWPAPPWPLSHAPCRFGASPAPTRRHDGTQARPDGRCGRLSAFAASSFNRLPGNQAMGSCRRPSNSASFLHRDPDDDSYTGSDVWRLIGGSLHDTCGPDSPGAPRTAAPPGPAMR